MKNRQNSCGEKMVNVQAKREVRNENGGETGEDQIKVRRHHERRAPAARSCLSPLHARCCHSDGWVYFRGK